MHIKDYNDAMTFFRNSKQLESNGKWKEFVDESKFDDMLQESRTMAQGGRIGFKDAKRVVNYPKNRAKKTVLPALDRVSKQLLDAFAKDDIGYIVTKDEFNKIGNFSKDDYQLLKRIQNNADDLAYVAGNTKWAGLDANDILNLIEDREAYLDLEKSSITQKATKETQFGPKRKFYKQAENWMVKNSSRYADPDKFKKAFIRTFGKKNHLIESINAGKATGVNVDFSDWFKESILGTSDIKKQPGTTYNSKLLDDIFKTSIYTNNKNVEKRIINELKRILPSPGSKRTTNIRHAFIDSPLLKKFGMNEAIRGPIARLLAKKIGDDMMKQISMFRDPFLGTGDLIRFLKDRVDPKYKSMFEEAGKAVSYAQKNQWPAAKKALNLSQNIMFDHKIPKALIALGYADDIEYIKLNPTSAEFNATIKRSQFDQPMIDLAKKYKKATTVDAKAKIVGEMNILKDKFSKKYGDYLKDVKITPDKTGKPIFSSAADVITKNTDLIKSLTTSLAQEKGHKTFAELYASKEGRKTLKETTSLTGINDYLRANGMDPICVTESPKKCGMDLIKSEGGVDAYRSELEKRIANAKGDEKWFKAYNNPKLASVKNFFKGAGKKLWKFGKATAIGELYYIPLGTAYEKGRGRNLLEALDNSIGLGGHFGMEEKNLMKYADKAGYSEEDKNFFKQFSQLEKNDNWTTFWEMAAAGDEWATEKIGKYYPGVPLWSLQEHAAGKVKDLTIESDDIVEGLYTDLGVENIPGKYGEREYLKDVQAIDWINKAKEKKANVIINRALAEKHGEPSLAPHTPAPDRWLVMDNLINAFTEEGREKIKKEGLEKEQAGPLWSALTSPVGALYAMGDKRIDREKHLEEAGREDLLYKEYMHPLYGPSFSRSQAEEQDRPWKFSETMKSRYFQADGGLTRTVAPDSEGIMSLKKKW